MQSETAQKEKLNILFQEYLDDSDTRAKDEITIRNRTHETPELQNLLHRFIDKQIDLKQLCDGLEFLFRRDDDPWFFKGFMIEIRKLRTNHDEHHPYAEDELRTLLTSLTSANLGARIEQFYDFLQNEQTRLRDEGKKPQQSMWPVNAGAVFATFYDWLNPSDFPVFYYPKTLRAIFRLIQEKLLHAPAAAKWAREFFIHTEQAHLDYQTAIVELRNTVSVLRENPFSTELFLNWYDDKLKAKRTESTQLIKEVDDTGILSGTADKAPLLVKDSNGNYTFLQGPLIPNAPLPAIPEELLQERIKEVQKYILLEEKIIRDIYHALLAGHVIMTGPPGTGKTELARLVPEILWGSDQPPEAEVESNDHQSAADDGLPAAYTTRLVTATDDWSVRTLIGGIAPTSKNGTVSYSIQYGYLTTTILNNWAFNFSRPDEWETLKRTLVKSPSVIKPGQKQEFRGRWLVIDEFNRAPIDLVLGDALTALGGSGFLRVPIEGGSAELPIPPDFRIIGTLNSFDRSYLNQISEALKRRFFFIEILPPTRAQRAAEQGIVLYKAFKRISHLSILISVQDDGINWQDTIKIEADSSGPYAIRWLDEQAALREAFEAAWHLFEVIRIYRQLGTAQAISLVRHLLITGILQDYDTREDWIAALDVALCGTLTDQLQVLLPDEIETLLLYLTKERDSFEQAYNSLLARLPSMSHRRYGQLIALGSVNDDHGQPFLTDEEIEQIAAQEQPAIPKDTLRALFHLKQPLYSRLPQFTRRLRTFKAERGL